MIGIFDSGFGGLTVMKEICKLLPHEDIVYFGDTARFPYGTKSRETILRYSLENSSFLIDQGVDIIVVACHTASSYALEELQKTLTVPVIGITDSTIEYIAQSSSRSIAILGTRGTCASHFYQTALHKVLPTADITAIPCQLLVHLIEEGYIDHPITKTVIQESLHSIKTDTLILGCTHFPLVLDYIQTIVGPHVTIIDPAHSCAESLRKMIQPKTSLPNYQFFVSDDPEKFQLLGEKFFGQSLGKIKRT